MLITPTSFTDNRRIEAEYLKDLQENRLKGTVSKDHTTNKTWKVLTMIRNKLTAIITREVYVTQAMFYRIIELAQTLYLVSLKTSILEMIEIVLTNVVIPVKATIDELKARMGVCKLN